MGSNVTRTEAEELTDAQAALCEAQRALRDLRSHLERIIANPEGAADRAKAARRNANIVLSELDQAGAAVRSARRLHADPQPPKRRSLFDRLVAMFS